MPRKKKSTTDGVYKITLTNGDVQFNATGNDLEETCEKLEKPKFTKGFTFLKLEKGKEVSEIRLRPLQVRKFGISKATRNIFGKRLELQLK